MDMEESGPPGSLRTDSRSFCVDERSFESVFCCGQLFLAGGTFLELGSSAGLGKAERFVPSYIASVYSLFSLVLCVCVVFILKQESSLAQVAPGG